MIQRLNHAVLQVSDVQASLRFYTEVLQFSHVASMGPGAVFLRAPLSEYDHDLGLFQARSYLTDHSGPGLFHLAWQVSTIDELAEIRERLLKAGALVGQSDHGVSKSVYGEDPDGLGFEVMWAVPQEAWPETVFTKTLDLEAERSRWSGHVTS